ncbi:MAG: alpha/beta fold hydrolase [bacterium]
MGRAVAARAVMGSTLFHGRSKQRPSFARRIASAFALAGIALVSMGDTCTHVDIPTRYPIVLAHGFAGWSDIGGYTYFYGVEEHLESLGYTVFAPAVSPVNGIDVRAQQLKDAILAEFPTGKVNLVAHSMGGLDARHMITHLGMADHVASLTTIATPHHGCVMSDMGVGNIPGATQEIIDWILNFWGLDWDAVIETTTEYVEETFNPTTPDMPGVAYYSYGGNGLYILNWKLVYSYAKTLEYQGTNDGMIGVSSAQWGTYLGTLDADHFDEVGQPPGATEFDHLAFYERIARFLYTNGF